jgi:hypothetical protein
MRENKKSQAIAVDTIVKIILGITIFGIGIVLFTQIFFESENQTEDLTRKIKNNIQKLECKGDDNICVSSINMRIGEEQTISVYISNKKDSDIKYSIKINNLDSEGILKKDSCGDLLINYYKKPIRISTGTSSSLPISIKTTRIIKKPCSFITSVSLMSGSNEIEKTNLIINIE